MPIFGKNHVMVLILPVRGIYPKFGKDCFFAENTRVESGYIYGGMPARRIKKVDADLGTVFERTAKNYIKYAEWFK